jgi:hypothetical protein
VHRAKLAVPTPKLLEFRDGKVTETNIIDSSTALRVEMAAKEVMKEESSIKGHPALFETTGIVNKGCLAATADSELRIRKKKSLDMDTVGNKRKRMGICEESNKRVAIEGRSLAVMRARREAPVSDAMSRSHEGKHVAKL